MDALTYTHSYASHEATTGIEYDFSEVDFFEWAKAPSALWLNLLAVGVVVTTISAMAPAQAVQVNTPSGRCLHARTGPSVQGAIVTCVRDGAALKAVVETKGDWLKLSSGRWVYGPYTTHNRAATVATPVATGNRLRKVNTPKDGCLNARVGPGIQYASAMCVRDGAALKTVTQVQGDWLQLASGRWVYGPYTAPIQGAPPAQGTGGRSVILMGSRGDAVKAVQAKLVELKYGVGPGGLDGIYGPNTKQAVEAFQKANGLTVDGIIGPATKQRLGV